jgi:hypothetical protein
MGSRVQETPSFPPRSFLSLVTGAQHIPGEAKGNGGAKEQGVCTRGSQPGAEPWRLGLCQKGVAHRALKHLANGDRGRDCPLPL